MREIAAAPGGYSLQCEPRGTSPSMGHNYTVDRWLDGKVQQNYVTTTLRDVAVEVFIKLVTSFG